jgi:hypothetical protein
MSQHTARPDPRVRSEDEEITYPQAREQGHQRPARPRQPLGQPAGGADSRPEVPGEPDEPDEGEFELIGDDDLSPADLGPANPNVTDPDAGSGRIRKIT